jgi:hypothetical protein
VNLPGTNMKILLLLLLALALPGFATAQDSVANAKVEKQQKQQIPMELYQLPFDLRQALPAIKVTVLHAPDDPEQRFVKINGERFAQGDNLELGPRIVEIRTDGVILEYQGQLLIIH